MVPQLDCTRTAEIHCRRADLPPELRRHPNYTTESPNWDAWFATEHNLRRRSRFKGATRGPPLPVKEEGKEVQQPFGESERKKMARWPGHARALAKSMAVMEANTPPPPPAPAPPTLEPSAEESRFISSTSTVPIYVSCTHPFGLVRPRRRSGNLQG